MVTDSEIREYARTDEQIDEVIEYILEKLLNSENIMIPVETLNKKYNLATLLLKIEIDPLHKYDYFKALISFNRDLQKMLDQLGDEIQSVIRKKMIPIHILTNELEMLQERLDKKETELAKQDKIIDSLNFLVDQMQEEEEEPEEEPKPEVKLIEKDKPKKKKMGYDS